ncbi:hypothetical protein Acr_00g0036880 [Actinidia rufa]|uniref:Uncharacterized protein n=1 Tax=Actinidia rufa TaxID=165716 RepID=A0A7J0DH49_9ERIC|nr:hypothetical protein Acr_00g0036880 [Actinidia rufa]
MREQRVNRMLLDGGLAVNILPLRAMKELGVMMEELSPSRLMIQGFNQGRQRAIGVLRLNLLIDDMTSSALFHVINAKNSYNKLLGRPWFHENGVIPSTLHQCFKYCRNGKLSSEAIGENVHGLNSTQNILKQKGDVVQNSHIGLGYTPPAPVRIVIKKSSYHYITTEENTSPTPTKPFVFDRLGKPKSRISVFDQLGSSSTDDEKMKSAIPSHMKCHTTIKVTTDEVLKMKLKIVIVTKKISEALDVPASEESVAFSYHITTLDGKDHLEEDAKDALLAFEDGVKSTIDDLKEINLGTLDDPRLVYVSALLTLEEQKMYIELLSKYKDVFAWSYKKMPGLNPKVVVYNLAVKCGVRPIKQA